MDVVLRLVADDGREQGDERLRFRGCDPADRCEGEGALIGDRRTAVQAMGVFHAQLGTAVGALDDIDALVQLQSRRLVLPLQRHLPPGRFLYQFTVPDRDGAQLYVRADLQLVCTAGEVPIAKIQYVVVHDRLEQRAF